VPGGAADCVTETARFAMVAVALRATLEFGNTVRLTVIDPTPLDGDTLTHGTSLVVVHGQFGIEAVTVTVTVPPTAGMARLAGETSRPQTNAC
jgi:hypothetical protein